MATPWVILGRIIRSETDAQDAGAGAGAQAQAQHAAAAAAPDITVPLVVPPGATVVSAGRRAHPIPDRPDEYPYIISAGPSCLLAHFSESPCHGTSFAYGPLLGHLVVLRDFHTAEGQMTATAEHIADRSGYTPVLGTIRSLVLASNDRGDYMIAELQVLTGPGSERATIVHLPSTTGHWSFLHTANPLPALDRDREWIPDGAVHVEGSFWWFDLSWGILSFDRAGLASDPTLIFHDLPDGRRLRESKQNIHSQRCITASRSKLRYVEIIVEGEPAAAVIMWTRNRVPGGWQWIKRYGTTFEDIWDDDSYRQTGLPRKVPELAVVCPSDPDLVYFALEQHLFCVHVPIHKVVHSGPYELAGPPMPSSGLFLIAWDLPPAVAA